MKGSRFVAALLAVGLGLSLAAPALRQMDYELDSPQKKAASSKFVRSSFGQASQGLAHHSEALRQDFRDVHGYEKKEDIGEPHGFARRDDVYKEARNNAKRDEGIY